MIVINPGESATLLQWQHGTPFTDDLQVVKLNGAGTPSVIATMIHVDNDPNTALDQGDVTVEGSLDRKFWYPVATLNFGEMYNTATPTAGGYVQATAIGELALDCNFVRIRPVAGIFNRLGPGLTNITVGA